MNKKRYGEVYEEYDGKYGDLVEKFVDQEAELEEVTRKLIEILNELKVYEI